MPKRTKNATNVKAIQFITKNLGALVKILPIVIVIGKIAAYAQAEFAALNLSSNDEPR